MTAHVHKYAQTVAECAAQKAFDQTIAAVLSCKAVGCHSTKIHVTVLTCCTRCQPKHYLASQEAKHIFECCTHEASEIDATQIDGTVDVAVEPAPAPKRFRKLIAVPPYTIDLG